VSFPIADGKDSPLSLEGWQEMRARAPWHRRPSTLTGRGKEGTDTAVAGREEFGGEVLLV